MVQKSNRKLSDWEFILVLLVVMPIASLPIVRVVWSIWKGPPVHGMMSQRVSHSETNIVVRAR